MAISIAPGDRFVLRHVLARNERSGKFHRLVQETDTQTGAVRMLSDERCQKDQMHLSYLSEAEAERKAVDAAESEFCGNCWQYQD